MGGNAIDSLNRYSSLEDLENGIDEDLEDLGEKVDIYEDEDFNSLFDSFDSGEANFEEAPAKHTCCGKSDHVCSDKIKGDTKDETVHYYLTGCSGELFYDNEKENFKEIKLIDQYGDAQVVLSLSSVDSSGVHELLSRFLNKHIRIGITGY